MNPRGYNFSNQRFQILAIYPIQQISYSFNIFTELMDIMPP